MKRAAGSGDSKNSLLKLFLLTFCVLIIYFCVTTIKSARQDVTQADIKLNADIYENLIQSDHDKNDPKEYDLKIFGSIFEGVGKNFSPYQIISDTVKRVGANQIILNNAGVEYVTENNIDLKIKADTGEFNDITKTVVMSRNVEVYFRDAFLRGDKIKFYLDSKDAESSLPVVLDYKNSKIKAQSFTTEDSADIITLEGRVESTLRLSDF